AEQTDGAGRFWPCHAQHRTYDQAYHDLRDQAAGTDETEQWILPDCFGHGGTPISGHGPVKSKEISTLPGRRRARLYYYVVSVPPAAVALNTSTPPQAATASWPLAGRREILARRPTIKKTLNVI